MPTIRELKVPLSKKQVAEKLAELSAACVNRDKWEAERKRMAGVFNQKIKAAKEQISTLSAATATGMAIQEVECDERINRDEGTMETYRIDNGETLEARPLEPDELNQVAPGDEEETE